MKRMIFLVALMACGLAACGQTGIYKHFAKRPNVRVYCVERYPLAVGDTACVTLLEANDSVTYKALRKELQAMPFTPRKNYNLYVPFVNPLEDSLRATVKPQHSDRKNSLEGFTLDGIDGDDGYTGKKSVNSTLNGKPVVVPPENNSLFRVVHRWSTADG